MAQNNISRKSAHTVDKSKTTVRGLMPDEHSGEACSHREVMSYVAEMATSLAELAANAREHEIAGMLHAAGRKARRAAATN
jgi:hypothetical protein